MLTCRKCARTNPAQATYCYFDGIALGRAAGPAARPVFTAPFAFPAGKTCHDFDQLALGCQEHWPAALELLQQGRFEQFLHGQGRADLAQAAREAARCPDRDRGLDQFLARLPSQAVPPPRLRVEPGDVNLGVLRLGADRQLDLHLENQGMRLMFGSVSVIDTPWLSVGARPGVRQKLFQFGGELTVPVHVIGKRLRASNKPLEGKLLVESNGGQSVVTIRAEVPIRPYPAGVLAGARSPRQLAEKAKLNLKEAAVEIEKGNVAQWYQDNGWTYPVRGPAASGLGAVQQYYEALGLTPPPKVAVSDKAVSLAGRPGQAVAQVLELRSEEMRPVYAHAKSDQPWLEVGRARLQGRVAAIPLRVSRVPDRPGESLHAQLTVTANGNQRFVIPVTLRIGTPYSVVTPVAVSAGQAGPLVARPRRSPAFHKAHLLPAALLALCLLLVIGGDLFRAAPDEVDPDIVVRRKYGTHDFKAPKRPEALSNTLHVHVQFTRETSRFGIVCSQLPDPLNPAERKRLTRDVRGMTNNVCFRIDGTEMLMRENPGVRWAWEHGRPMLEAPIPQGVYGDRVPVDRGWRTKLHDEHHRVTITQDVEIIVSDSTGLYDTVLVTYLITNADSSPHSVGLRFLLDTYVGSNDGVPILYPPHGDGNRLPGGFVDGLKIFPQKDVPDFLQAVENGKLGDAGNTVAVLGLRLGSRYEVPEKVVVCRWPQNSEVRWAWPPERIDANPHVPDSCVAIYWGELMMAGKSQRLMGFTYGLGRMAGIQDGDEIIAQGERGQLRLFVQRPKYNQPFTVTTYVQTKRPGERVQLLLPSGLRLAPGQSADQAVPPMTQAGYAAVSWQVIADQTGPHEVKARVNSIGTAKVTVRVKRDGIFD